MEWLVILQNRLRGITDDTELLLLGFSILVAIATLLIFFAVYFFASGLSDPLRKRVNQLTEQTQKNLKAQRAPTRVDEAIDTIGGQILVKEPAKRRQIETLLVASGFRSDGALRTYLGLSLTAMVGSPILAILITIPILHLPIDEALPYTLLAFAAGAILPQWTLKKLALRRQLRLRQGLPDAMDLLVVCTEAGLGLNGAIGRVATELAISHRELAEELAMFPRQTRAGMDSRSALKDLAERNGVEEIQSLVTLLIQGMRFGAGIAESMRIFSEDLRTKRLQQAEERAAKIGIKIIFPVILCILPSFLLAILGPVVIYALKQF